MYALAWEVVGYYRLEKTSLPEVTSEPESEERGSKSGGIWGKSSGRGPSTQSLRLDHAACWAYS